MNTEQETDTRVEESELNLGDILQTVLANWYWFGRLRYMPGLLRS